MSGDWLNGGLNFTPKVQKLNVNTPIPGAAPFSGFTAPGSGLQGDTFVRTNNLLFAGGDGVPANVYGVSQLSLSDVKDKGLLHGNTLNTLLLAGQNENFEFPPI